jgi:hypothetical protein
MTKKIAILASAAALVCLAPRMFAAGAGDGEPVKAWYGKAYESLKDATKPIAVYIYDAKVKANHKAVAMEGKTFLDNSDVASKLKGFICIKLKADPAGTQEKSWPAQYIAGANGNASLILLSSDLRCLCTFDRGTPASDLTSDNLVKALDRVLAAEPKDLEKKKKEEKEKEKQLAAANAKKEDAQKNEAGGLGIKGITDQNKDDPAAAKKGTDTKKSDPPPAANKPKPLDE